MRRILLLMAVTAVAVLVASGVALAVVKKCPTDCVGTPQPDTLQGSSNPNHISGRGSGDLIHGWRGDDTLRGNGGADAVYGDLADDVVYGNAGNDFVEGGFGHDYINTGKGSDKVAAADGYKDRIVCGQGNRDRVYKDPVPPRRKPVDRTVGCERTLNQEPSP
jgi:Ca2+-binding RTX toxin-like protein